MPKTGADSQIGTKFKKKTFELRMTTIDRLNDAKKKRGITMNWYVDNAIVNELNSDDRYEKIDEIFREIKNSMPELIRNAVDNSDLNSIMNEWAKDLKPTIDLSKLQAAELQSREAAKFEARKLNMLHRIINKHPISRDQVSAYILDALVSDGYIVQVGPHEFQPTTELLSLPEDW